MTFISDIVLFSSMYEEIVSVMQGVGTTSSLLKSKCISKILEGNFLKDLIDVLKSSLEDQLKLKMVEVSDLNKCLASMRYVELQLRLTQESVALA